MKYPNLFRRYLASLIDMVTVITIVYFCVNLPWYQESGGSGAAVFFIVALSYEPLLTAFACTLGQALMRFRVRTVADGERVGVFWALIRMCVKYALGLISFLTMPARSDRRAMHDLVAGTIVVEAGSVIAVA